MTNNSKEIAIFNRSNEVRSYCSFAADSMADKVKLYKAMSASDKKLSDCINAVIKVKDVYIEKIDMVNKESGEIVTSPRVVLFDTDGVSYSCVSFGVINAIEKLFICFGEPTWKDGLPVKVVQVNNKDRKMLSLEIHI